MLNIENPCACGCGKVTKTKFIHGHNRRKDPTKLYKIDKARGCWNWNGGSFCGNGSREYQYGRFRRNGKMVMAHRYFYEQAKGEILKGFCIDHLCRNSRCVNPDHLEAVSTAENIRRGNSTTLTMQDVLSIRQSKPPLLDIARRHNISLGSVLDIRCGRRWVAV